MLLLLLQAEGAGRGEGPTVGGAGGRGCSEGGLEGSG